MKPHKHNKMHMDRMKLGFHYPAELSGQSKANEEDWKFTHPEKECRTLSTHSH